MHLSDAESKRFLSLMALVQTYVITAGDFMLEDDEEFDGRVEVEVDLDDTRSDTPRLSDVSETDALRACEIAATFSDVFDGVFEDYGDDLDASDIRVLNLWQKGWFATYGAILSYTDNGDALLQTEMGVVQVSGVTQEISDIVPDVPMFIRTVVMPFEGSIVYCGLIAEYPINYGPGIVKSFDEVLAAIEEGREEVIRTSEVYCERLAAYKAKEREESFDELMSGIEHEVSKRDGETERAGLRRSVLLDLDESEREEAIDRQFWRELDLDDDLTLDIALERAIHAAPREDLRTALGDLDRNQLEDAAELVLHREPPSDRAEMIDAIVSACDDAVAIRQFLTLSSKKHYEFFLKIVKAEGRLVVDQDDDDELRAAQACPPFSFLYYDEDQEELIGAIVGDFLDQLTDEDVVTSINARERIIDMAHYADIAAGLYGVIPVEEFSELYGDDRHWDADFESVLGILGHLLYYQERDFTIESLGGVPYLIHNGIALQFLDDFDELSDSEMEGITESLVDFMAEILDAHERLERRPIGDIADAEDVQEWVIRRESALRLRDWLDEHVPDGESEYFFSDRILEDIYLSTWRPFDPSYVPQLLVEAYETTLESDEHIAMFNDLLSLATRFVNDIPRWDNYGYSAWELMEKQTGKKTFFNDDGSVKKVGRNDPCPCGSGKKYKKCCGR